MPLIHDIHQLIHPPSKDQTSKLSSGLHKCKSLARVLKAQRAAAWPPSSPAGTSDLPEKHITDALVDQYLRTSEKVYRVLHIPTFTRDYEAFWAPNSKPASVFVVLLKLVLAIGSVTYDSKFSLRRNAISWIYDALSWHSEPVFKPRLSLQSLQVDVLLLIARDFVEVGSDLLGPAAGELIHRAVNMGLHKDPSRLESAAGKPLINEMRRRLWNTILEIAVQFSIALGMPLFISEGDFDTKPPSNYDDEQLTPRTTAPENATAPSQLPEGQRQQQEQGTGRESSCNVRAKPEMTCTQTSIAIALRKSLVIRLSVVKFLNGVSGLPGSYEEALRLDSQLREVHKSVRHAIQAWSPESISTSRFEILFLELVHHRFLLALHIPYLGPALNPQSGSAYAFSRQVILDAALQIWCIVIPASFLTGGAAVSAGGSATELAAEAQAQVDKENDIARFIRCGSGSLHSAAVQVFIVVCIELRTEVRQPHILGPVPLRRDLFSVIEEAKSFTYSAMEAGHSNAKCHVMPCIAFAQIHGTIMGLNNRQVFDMTIRAGEDAADRCIQIFERAVQPMSQIPTPSWSDFLGDDFINVDNPWMGIPQNTVDDWDFIVRSSFFFFTAMIHFADTMDSYQTLSCRSLTRGLQI